MANVIIEELDSISEDSFATGESDRSVDDFHDLETEVPRTTGGLICGLLACYLLPPCPSRSGP